MSIDGIPGDLKKSDFREFTITNRALFRTLVSYKTFHACVDKRYSDAERALFFRETAEGFMDIAVAWPAHNALQTIHGTKKHARLMEAIRFV